MVLTLHIRTVHSVSLSPSWSKLQCACRLLFKLPCCPIIQPIRLLGAHLCPHDISVSARLAAVEVGLKMTGVRLGELIL